MTIALFLTLGIIVGLIGTLVGIGGGFIMIPVLWAFYPDATPDQITAISYFTIFANSLSGTVSYARLKRIDYRSGTAFALGAFPGVSIGTWLTTRISMGLFEGLLAVMMAVSATLLIVLGGKEGLKKREEKLAAEGHLAHRVPLKGLILGGVLSIFVGLIASMVGIGGGIIHVPMMVFILSFAVHRATATSHFVLAISSFAVTAQHLLHGSYGGYWPVTLALAAGAIVAAQVGAHLSTKTAPTMIIRGLAVILLLVAGRLGYHAYRRATAAQPAQQQTPPSSPSPPLPPTSPGAHAPG